MKRIVTILLLLVCAAAGAVRWLDVMYYTDLATGFVTWGSYLWRYALAGGVLVLLWLAGWMMPKTSASLKGQSTAQGLVALVCGVGFAALGGVYLAAFDQLGRFELALAVLYLPFFASKVFRSGPVVELPFPAEAQPTEAEQPETAE